VIAHIIYKDGSADSYEIPEGACLPTPVYCGGDSAYVCLFLTSGHMVTVNWNSVKKMFTDTLIQKKPEASQVELPLGDHDKNKQLVES